MVASAGKSNGRPKDWDPDAEQSIIGAIFLENDAAARVALAPEEFYDPRARETFAAILRLRRKARPIDPVTIADELGHRAFAVGDDYVSECVGKVPTAGNVEFYAAIVREHAITRSVHLQASELLHSQLAGGELLARARQSWGALLERKAEAKLELPLPPNVEAVLRSDAFKRAQTTFRTGFHFLDRLLDGGVKCRQLTSLAAPTGAGKTAFACELARRLCKFRPVLYISTEIEKEELGARTAGPLIGARASELLSLQVDPLLAADAIAGWPIYLHELDDDDLGVSDIAALAERMRNTEGDAPIIIVDYLQHLANAADDNALRVTVKRIANQLRRLARAFDTAVIAISSVSRSFYGPGARKLLEEEEDPRAWLTAGKESGDIEYATAVFLYLETDGFVDVNGYSHARIVVAKSRRGRPGFVGLKFHGPTGAWFDSSDALQEMGPARRFAELERRILQAVKDATHPITKSDVPGILRSNKSETLQAIERLIAGKKLETYDMKRMNGSGQLRTVKGLALPGQQGALNVAN